MSKVINTFDIDGVIYLDGNPGVRPGVQDIIITGRSIEEQPETMEMLERFDIHNAVLFNSLPFEDKTRHTSGTHKAERIIELMKNGFTVLCHFEDDLVQIDAMKSVFMKEYGLVPINIIHVNTNGLVELENVRHV